MSETRNHMVPQGFSEGAIIPLVSKLSPEEELQRIRDREKLEHITMTVIAGIQALSLTQQVIAFKGISTLGEMEFWRRKAETDGIMTPEIAAWLQHRTQDYLIYLEQLSQASCQQILQVIDNISVKSEDVGILRELRSAVMLRLTGK